MEYSQSSINGGVTYHHVCEKCGHEKHHVKGAIKYAFIFLESLPMFPVGRSVSLECADCAYVTPQELIDESLKQQLHNNIFTIFHFAKKFAGLVLSILLCYFWWQSHVAIEKNTEKIIRAPQIHDYMMLDYRKFSDDLRPNERFRLAKVVDITGDTVSMVYGNYFYKRESAFEDVIKVGQVTNYRYFGKARYHFSYDELYQLYQEQAIVVAGRPEANFLYGTYVLSQQPGYQLSHEYIAGEREYASGLAFEQANYLADHLTDAFGFFEKSAKLGFYLGQIKLAEYYLTGKAVEVNFDQALHWLEMASLQSSETAINKFAIVCKQTRGCDLPAFYQRVIDQGVNLTVNGDIEIN